MPQGRTDKANARRNNGHLAYFDFGPGGYEYRLNPTLRNMDHVLRVHEYLESHRHDAKYQSLYGLKERHVFMYTAAFYPSWSASLDIMHLLSNISKAMYQHYIGPPGGPGQDQEYDVVYVRVQSQAPQSPEESDSENGVDGQNADDDQLPPAQPDHVNDYVVSLEEWVRICNDQEESRRLFSPSIGNIVSITSGRFTTADWFIWTLHQSPIYLYGLLPDVHFRGYILFVQAFKNTLQKSFR
ncbi:hypothetical protein BJ508DRAFT_364111 [Ascobolus immersus RN42]|uniref:Uncharacterized protein n=1 Tax=Ascobolus immersus RN42 TaxID=1160509 RepID=A0A3N4I130_ASCIM|nr:hypothetical protein BJ508DRAFT_364111 [Ascobolus immersus RN42]